jgi:hypothetical protein
MNCQALIPKLNNNQTMNSISNLLSNNSLKTHGKSLKKPNLQLTQAFVYYEVNKAISEVLADYPEVAEYLTDLKIAVNSKNVDSSPRQSLISANEKVSTGLTDNHTYELPKTKNTKTIEVIFSSSSSTFRTFLKLNAPDIKSNLSSRSNFENIEFIFVFR